MGCFGYICKYCRESVRNGEKCVMFHVRHGKKLGEVTGTYDSYGRVEEQENLAKDIVFRGEDGVNSHDEICKSEFEYLDSWDNVKYEGGERLYNGKYCTFKEYLEKVVNKELKEANYNILNMSFYNYYKYIKPNVFNYVLEHNDLLLLKSYPIDLKKAMRSMLKMGLYTIIISEWYNLMKINSPYYREFLELKERVFEKYSGIVCYHKVCYDKALKQNNVSLEPSDRDPNQSWGKPRNKFK